MSPQSAFIPEYTLERGKGELVQHPDDSIDAGGVRKHPELVVTCKTAPNRTAAHVQIGHLLRAVRYRRPNLSADWPSDAPLDCSVSEIHILTLRMDWQVCLPRRLEMCEPACRHPTPVLGTVGRGCADRPAGPGAGVPSRVGRAPSGHSMEICVSLRSDARTVREASSGDGRGPARRGVVGHVIVRRRLAAQALQVGVSDI